LIKLHLSSGKSWKHFLRDTTRLNRPAFNIFTGLRSAVFVMAALLLGYIINKTGFPFAGLGAIFLFNTEGQLSKVPASILLVAWAAEALSLGVGTVVGSLGIFSLILTGFGVFLISIAASKPAWMQLGTITAIVFAVSVGLPGDSFSQAAVRMELCLLGSIVALVGVMLDRFVATRVINRMKKNFVKNTVPMTSQSPSSSLNSRAPFSHAIVLGVACTIGSTIGFAFGLPRDYWIDAMIILLIRVSFGSAVAFASIIFGTIAGALIAAIVTLTIINIDLLLLLLFAFAVLMFSVRGVNLGLLQIFLVPFIIILLNIMFPGQWEIAIYRVLDVTLGGVIALTAAYLLAIRNGIPNAQLSIPDNGKLPSKSREKTSYESGR
jgi:hypothetical protein